MLAEIYIMFHPIVLQEYLWKAEELTIYLTNASWRGRQLSPRDFLYLEDYTIHRKRGNLECILEICSEFNNFFGIMNMLRITHFVPANGTPQYLLVETFELFACLGAGHIPLCGIFSCE